MDCWHAVSCRTPGSFNNAPTLFESFCKSHPIAFEQALKVCQQSMERPNTCHAINLRVPVVDGP